MKNEQDKYKRIQINDNDYLIIARSEEIFEGKGRQFFFGDEHDMQLAVFRVKGTLYCVNNICPHRHQDQIHNGIIDDLNIVCPVHYWTYNLQTGQNINQKQGVKSLSSYEIFESDGLVYLEDPKIDLPKWRTNKLETR